MRVKIGYLREWSHHFFLYSSNKLYSIILFYLNFLYLQLDFIRLLDILAKNYIFANIDEFI